MFPKDPPYGADESEFVNASNLLADASRTRSTDAKRVARWNQRLVGDMTLF